MQFNSGLYNANKHKLGFVHKKRALVGSEAQTNECGIHFMQRATYVQMTVAKLLYIFRF